MTDDRARARKLLEWQATPAGGRVLDAWRALVRRGLHPWAKAGGSLLEVNCGSGGLQAQLRSMGFDVTGAEPSPALREAFVSGLGSRFTVDPAHADLLPHPDGGFDWVLLHLERGTSRQDLPKAVAEARRVAARGLAVLVWNRLSPAALLAPGLPLLPVASIRAWRILAAHGEGRTLAAGALFGPSLGGDGEIRVRGPLRCLFGAALLLRLDLSPSLPLTATPLPVRKPRFKAAPVADGCGDGAFGLRPEPSPGQPLLSGAQPDRSPEPGASPAPSSPSPRPALMA